MEIREPGNYLILDAKYSYRKKVLQELMPEMSYKYLLSLSRCLRGRGEEGGAGGPGPGDPLRAHKWGAGTGKLLQLPAPGTSILPAANVIPFAETVTEENQQKNIRELLREMRG